MTEVVPGVFVVSSNSSRSNSLRYPTGLWTLTVPVPLESLSGTSDESEFTYTLGLEEGVY